MKKHKFKGKVTLDNGYIMVMDMSALLDFEELTGKDAFDVITGMESGKVWKPDMRAFYYVCLKRHQPEIDLVEATEMMIEYPEAFKDVLLAAAPEGTTSSAPAPEASSRGATKKVGDETTIITLLRAFIRDEFTYELFLTLTPKQYMLHMQAAADRKMEHVKLEQELAWIHAYYQRVPKLPKFADINKENKKDKPLQTVQEFQMKMKLMTYNLPKKTWAEYMAEHETGPR